MVEALPLKEMQLDTNRPVEDTLSEIERKLDNVLSLDGNPTDKLEAGSS